MGSCWDWTGVSVLRLLHAGERNGHRGRWVGGRTLGQDGGMEPLSGGALIILMGASKAGKLPKCNLSSD